MRLLSPLQWLFFVGFLPFGLLCCAENRADAGCGDYVRIASAKPKDAASQGPHDERSPCHEPNCQQKSPGLPLPAPAAPTVQAPVPDILLDASVELEDLPASEPIACRQSPLSQSLSEPIFHPPRRIDGEPASKLARSVIIRF